MPVKTKRWNDPAEPSDGTRVLVTRFRPRGLPRDQECWDAWMKELGPSAQLHAEVYGKRGPPLGWEGYRVRYLEEMRAQRPAIESIARRVAAGETVTLCCSSACVEEARCHRSLLKRLIEEEVPRFR